MISISYHRHNPYNPLFGYRRTWYVNTLSVFEGQAHWLFLGFVDVVVRVQREG